MLLILALAAALQGQLLDGQFELVRAVEGSQKLISAFPLKDYPADRQGQYIARGSFGEAWEAYELGPSGEKVLVVVKIFYRKEQDAYGREKIVYLKKNNLLAKERDAIEEATKECELVRGIVASAPAEDVGKGHFVNCLHDRVSGRGRDELLYLVLEHGGSSLADFVKTFATGSSLEQRRVIMLHLLRAVRTMGERLNPPLVHHDLKPANAVYDGKTVRLIDFGGAMQGTVSQMYAPAVATKGYAPPEFLGLDYQRRVAFELPAHSYDVYALGVIYLELMCPQVRFDRLVSFARSRAKSASSLQSTLRIYGCSLENDDAKSIAQMIAYSARDRPSPSQALSEAPFHFLDSGDLASPDVASADASDLVNSLLPKDERNPNLRRGGGLFELQDRNGWTEGRECGHLEQTLLEGVGSRSTQFASLSGTRAQCEAACAKAEQRQPSAFAQLVQRELPQAREFCCQLDAFYDRTLLQSSRRCSWGWGELVTGSKPDGNSYARIMPLSAAGAKPDAAPGGAAKPDAKPSPASELFGNPYSNEPAVPRAQPDARPVAPVARPDATPVVPAGVVRAQAACMDIAGTAKDKLHGGCEVYETRRDYCGVFDTVLFKAKKMCCACGGGYTPRDPANVVRLTPASPLLGRGNADGRIDIGDALLRRPRVPELTPPAPEQPQQVYIHGLPGVTDPMVAEHLKCSNTYMVSKDRSRDAGRTCKLRNDNSESCFVQLKCANEQQPRLQWVHKIELVRAGLGNWAREQWVEIDGCEQCEVSHGRYGLGA